MVSFTPESRNARWHGEEGPEKQKGPGGTQQACSKERRTNGAQPKHWEGEEVWVGVWGGCLWARGSAPAAGAEQQPRGVVCTGTSNWGHWDPRAATGQTECLSLAPGGTHTVHMFISIFHTNRPQSAREGNKMRRLVLFVLVFVWVLSVSQCVNPCGLLTVYVYIHIYVCMHVCAYICVVYLCLCVCAYWEYMLNLPVGPGSTELSSLTSAGLSDLAPPNKTN